MLRACKIIIENQATWDLASLEAQIKAMTETANVKLGVCINALRIALTGKPSGVGVFDAFAILGKQSALARIDRAIQLAS
jgi:glutamyl-tRNA synthetase